LTGYENAGSTKHRPLCGIPYRRLWGKPRKLVPAREPSPLRSPVQSFLLLFGSWDVPLKIKPFPMNWLVTLTTLDRLGWVLPLKPFDDPVVFWSMEDLSASFEGLDVDSK
jgi:hypothetical protein